MNNIIYAGIGARDTPEDILYLMKIIGIYLAGIKCTLNTGAAPGADQAFARGAISNGGNVNLFLPWPKYEKGWINSLISNNFIFKNNISVSVLNKKVDIEAIKSVHRLHPSADKLEDSIIALHARNYLVLKNAKFAICYTKNGAITGGTGQSIRIMASFGRKVFNLGRREDKKQVIKFLGAIK